ncbi:MFS transporter [Kitasatospora sp. NPDC057198]|uniref:MFS transporter n=1 Tax=Kitasatospora sp. NPDC057198 TaxID=3346046 RepID=UPI00363A82D2
MPVGLDVSAEVLRLGFAPLRAATGGGVRHGTEAYVFVFDVEHLMSRQHFFETASFGVFTAAAPDRMSWKYPNPRAYRFPLQNIGHAARVFAMACGVPDTAPDGMPPPNRIPHLVPRTSHLVPRTSHPTTTGTATRGTGRSMSGTRPAPGLRTNRNWQKLWLGQAVSQFGDFVFDTTLVLWVGAEIAAGASYAPAAVSGVLIAAAVPTVLVGPLAGVYADRWNRRRTMMAADLVRAALVGLLVVVSVVGSAWSVGLRLALVYTVVALSSVAAQFFNPSRFATIGAVVAEADQPQAYSLATASANSAAVLGPPLAAPLLFSVGAQWALVVNAASFLVSFACIAWTRIDADGPAARPVGKASGLRAELAESWRFIAASPVLRTVTVTLVVYTFGVGLITVLEIFFVAENLHADADWVGTLNGALGAGSVLGALLAPRLMRRTGTYRLLSWGVLVTAVLVGLFARSSSVWVAVAVIGLIGVPLALVNTVLGPIILAETPAGMLGRVSAAINPLVFLASVSSMVIAGLLASALSPDFSVTVLGVGFHRTDTIFLASGLIMVCAGLYAVSRVRSVEAAPGRAARPAAGGAVPAGEAAQ